MASVCTFDQDRGAVAGSHIRIDPLELLVISCSLDPESKSRQLAVEAARIVEKHGVSARIVDLRQLRLPTFDNTDAHHHTEVVNLKQAILRADAVIIAAPVYNWSLSSVAKNMVELTGATGTAGRRAAWFDKLVTFICAGGLPHSYTAYTDLASSMALDFKCIVNPYMVYATDRDLSENSFSESVNHRMHKTIDVTLELAALLRARTYSSDWEI